MADTHELERLLVRLSADASMYDQVLSKVEKSTAQIAKRLESLGTRLSLAITAPLTAMGYLAVREFSKFDDAMTKSLAIMGKVAPEIRKEMEETARSISRNGVSSADKVAEAYYFLASAGLDASASIKALPVVERFAVAGAFDMAKATEMLADSQSALGLAVKDPTQRMLQMARVSDVLVEAANMSNASQEQFAKSLTTKSAVAMKEVNKEIEEGVAILSVYADQGIKGEMAGEKFSIMMRELKTASQGRSKPIWTQFGIDVFDKTTGAMRHTADILADLEKKQKGMTDQQKYSMMSMMGFRSESLGAIQPLIGLSDKVREYEKRLKNAGGATQDVADKQLKSFANQMANMKNRLYDIAITIGSILAPMLARLNSYLQIGIDYWNTLSPATQEWIVYAGLAAAAMGPFIFGMGKLMSVLPMMIREFMSLFAVVKAVFTYAWAGMKAFTLGLKIALGAIGLLNPWVLLLAAGIAAVTWVLVGNEGFVAAWDWVRAAAMTAFENIMGFMANFQHNMGAILSWLGENWWNIIKDMGSLFLAWVMSIPQNTMAGLTLAMRLFVAFQGYLSGLLSNLFTYIFSDQFVNALANGIENAITLFGGFVDYLITTFLNFVNQATSWFMSIFSSEQQSGKTEEEAKSSATTITQAAVANQHGFMKVLNDHTAGVAAGKGGGNFGKVAMDIIKDPANGFKNPLDDFKSNITEGPDLKFDRGTEMPKADTTDQKLVRELIKPAETDASLHAQELEDAKKKKKSKKEHGKDEMGAVTRFSTEAYSTLTKAAAMGPNKLLEASNKRAESMVAKAKGKGSGDVALAAAAQAGDDLSATPATPIPVQAGASSSIAGLRKSDPQATAAEAGISMVSELKFQTRLLTEIRDDARNETQLAISE